MAADPYKYFRIEATELHRELGQGVLDLERGDRAADLVPRLLRAAHTLKGAARVVKQPEIADQAHAFEEVVGPLRDPSAQLERAQIDRLFGIVDTMGTKIAALAAPPPASIAPAARPEEPAAAPRTDVRELDAVLDGLAESLVLLDAVRRNEAAVERASRLADILADQLASPRPSAAKSRSLADELRGAIGTIRRDLAEGVGQLDQELRHVREVSEHMRLVPASSIFTLLERTARDVAKAQGKRVTFEGRGGDVRVDAHLLAAVQGALVQLVRNAVAHGVELVPDRRIVGKPDEGRVTIDFVRRGRSVDIICKDDGKGIDRDALAQAAARSGVPTDGSLLDLLLRGRVSTSSTVTEVSGRGIGLDLLREAAEKLHGVVRVDTERLRGTTFTLSLPLSLASLQVLLVESGGSTVAIPLDAVRVTARIGRHEIARTAHAESIVHEGATMPFVSLARVLLAKMPPPARPTTTAVIVTCAGNSAAVGVERLLGTATIIQRPVPDTAPLLPVVSGISIDASGNPRLVLDPEGLVTAAHGAGLLPEVVRAKRHRILVVDDSMTTRMLEQSILESAGYDVDTAMSAEEGLEKVEAGAYALFLVDVEMPGMDGFGFVDRTRGIAPAILVSSRNLPEDFQRGRDVGAKGYIVKGEFDQNELLAQIRKLVTS